MNEPREPLGAVEYHLVSTVSSVAGDVIESAPVSTQRAVAVSIAQWVMQGYLRDRFTVVANPIRGRWTAYKGGMLGKITLEIREVFNN